jgi:gliding motility-associated-like protein
MKKELVLVISLIWIGCFSQTIKVDTNTYSVTELVTDILVNKACVPVTNITWRTGNTDGYGSSNGIGYFKNTNPDFPLANGVILSTGNVKNAPGPNASQLNDGNSAWIGDADLEATLLAAGIAMKSTNATVLEFDFVPFSPNFDFQFLFASEEYGNFQCQFSDAFAFLLTNKSTGITTNLAVVPNTNDPISVVTIRNSLYNSSCSSENPTYFGTFNGGTNGASSATNFNGQTVVMNASSTTLIPNTTYHIKLVIADRKDNQADSAIFLSANSFNVGQDVLGPDLTVANKTAICDKGTHTLISGLDPAIYSFAWTFNGNPTGGNTPDLTVSKAGVYGLTYTIIEKNCPVTTDFIKVEYYNPIITPTPVDLFHCNSGEANTSFDLSYNTKIVAINGIQISYHTSLLDATLNNNPLPDNYTISTSSLPATIWIRILNTTTGCFTTKTFQLKVTPPPVANKPNNLTLCEATAKSNKANFNLDSQTATILGGQSAAIYDVSYYTTLANANVGINQINPSASFTSGNTTLFARIQTTTDPSCFEIVSFDLIVIPSPNLDLVSDKYVCSSYTLPPLINSGNYYSAPNQGLPMLHAGDVITVNKTIYLYSATTGTPSCPSESNFKIKIVKISELNPDDVTACDQYRLLASSLKIRYFTLAGGPSGGGTEISGGTVLKTPGTITVYTYFSSTDTSNPCILEGKFNITINSTPKIAAIANVFECTSYDLPPLAVGDYYTYNSISKTYTPAISPITSTTKLYVFATSPAGCRSSDRVFTVYINSLGLNNINTCLPYNLPAAPVGEYRDAPNGEGNTIHPGLISKTITVYPYVPGAGTPNCTDDDFFTITINAPFLSTPENVATCDSFTLPEQFDGGDYYTLSGGPTTPKNKKLIPNIDKITTTSTVYIFKPSTIVGCYNEKPWLITIYQKPKLDSRASIEQCNSYILTPISKGKYYSNPNGVNPLVAGTIIKTSQRIYIYATNENDPSCFSESFFDITINGVETDPVPSQLTYCESFTFPPLPTPNNFYYDTPGGPLGGGNKIPAGTTITAATALPTYYIYYETGNRLNCSDEKPFNLKIAPLPVANSVNPIETCDTFGANDGIFEFDLTTSTIRNQVLGSQIPDADFTLSFHTSLADANDINASPIANPSIYKNDTPFTNSVWIRVQNNSIPNPCFDVVELKLIVNPLPNPKLDSEYFICEDYETGTLLNSATLDTGISGANYLFEWTLDGNPYGGNTGSITTSQAGDYLVKVTNTTTACDKTLNTKVNKYAPHLEITYSDTFESPTFITVNVLGAGSENYEYKLDDSLYQDSNQFTNVTAGEHYVSVKDKNGHCNPPSLQVTIINYPKFFSPNGDGYNDTWNIPHLLTTNPNASIAIFDRYGKLIKEITPSSEGWNGLLNGHQLPATDYWFTVEYNEKGNSKIFKSHFSLKR